MAYGGLQDFLREQQPAYTTTLVQTRVLPLYSLPFCPPYLVAAACWVLGELASCLPEEMSSDIYSSLFKALAMPDKEDISCYPVRVAAAGVIAGLLEVVVRGFEALAVMAQSWESFVDEEVEQNDSTKPTVPIDGNVVRELKLSELLPVWADLIADWHAWEESEDLSVFDCIKEVVSLHNKYGLENFIVRQTPPAPPVPQRSIIEAISAFVSGAILQYPSATWRACSSVHILLHVPTYSGETAVEAVLEEGDGDFVTWASSLALACTRSSEVGLSAKSEIKLAGKHLSYSSSSPGRITDRNSHAFFVRSGDTELDEEMEEEENGEESEDDNNDEEDDDEIEIDDEGQESESEIEETEEQFLERYAQAASALEDGIVE
ncbi:1-cysteine peroxiredoxin 1 [Hibiscus syriacus]|uniref:1-cysteine peroxiredoxin 1 n=1 Tax=Hibiscus syriacus TaxID=106335 RepID=A0A6A2YVK4_HIBSY|nr:1-cysteine peroxiredoxin 1 [Hibiscus syriacus]